MKLLGKSGSAVLGGMLLVGVSTAPALANDASVSLGTSVASYTDNTDRLCAKSNAAVGGTFDYAVAQIVNINNGNVLFSVTDEEGGGNTCTGNLSIAEDRQFYLRVSDCSQIPGTPCGSRQVTFYS